MNNRHFTWTKSLRGSYSLYNMDLEFDSDLDEIEEVEIIGHAGGTIQPYLYEPVSRTRPESSSDSEPDSSDSSFVFSEDDDAVPDVSTWCLCGNCRSMATLQEAKCCQTTNVIDGRLESEGIKCITHHDGFIANCLNIHVLETSYYEYVIKNGPLEEHQLIHEVYRYIAYRRFTRWVYGLLGKKNRKVIPSCAVVAIRDRFPSERYCGFKYPQ